MHINRQNYETFFLLYADNELSAAERKTVEEFVDANPDLAEELQSLLDVILPAEISTADFKSNLYKKEIELDSLQESMLMALDGELDPVQAKKIQSAIKADINLQKEWNTWQQTTLDPKDKMVFADKKSLYRKEEGRVVSISFWRVAVAAAVLLFGLFIGINYFKKQDAAQSEFVKSNANHGQSKETGSKPATSDPINTPQTVAEEKDTNTEAQQSTASADPGSDKQKTVNESQVSGKKQPVNTDNAEKSIAVKPATNNKREEKPVANSKTSLENINNPSGNESTASTVTNNKGVEVTEVEKIPEQQLASTTTDKKKIAAPSRPVIDYNSIPPMETNSYAKTASFSDSDPGNDNKVLYMSEGTINRTKLGGFLRKVKRTIERNTSVKTGNGIKIAGFEFASK